jgi:hypothetical protein
MPVTMVRVEVAAADWLGRSALERIGRRALAPGWDARRHVVDLWAADDRLIVGLGIEPNTLVKHMATLALTPSTNDAVLALGSSGAMSSGDVMMPAGALIPIQAGMPLGR